MPENTPAVQVRFARHTDRLTEIVAFYRDGLGLPQVGSFTGHDGYDGVFLALPGTRAHLEFTSGGAHDAPGAHPETLLVLYLGTAEAVRDALARVGSRHVKAANPYWDTHGVTILDPDGFRIVLVAEHWDGDV
jgi:catechol 2,3-dioxygenase-like lactoylglutathione lyase family enzyme